MSSERTPLQPPDGKPLIVHIEVNVEVWPFDAPVPRTLLTAPHGIAPVPDVPNFSWFEYGMRCGMPRLLRAIGDRGLPATCAMNAAVIEVYPSCAEAVRDIGWEFIGHGGVQQTLEPETEAEVIRESVDALARFSGRPVVGWLGPGMRETDTTPDLLKESGIRYVCDWGLDDLPCWMSTARGPLLALPNTLEHDDSLIYAVEKHSSDEIYRRLVETLITLDAELGSDVRVLTLGLHPHLTGATHRFPYLERMLDTLLARNDTIFMTGSEIADWFEAAALPPHA
jgi:peptidoglycan/xylan/chitin deacetylase (PgdA/CDA1 family)